MRLGNPYAPHLPQKTPAAEVFEGFSPLFRPGLLRADRPDIFDLSHIHPEKPLT